MRRKFDAASVDLFESLNYKTRRALSPPERKEQAAVFEWAHLMAGNWPELHGLFHVENEGIRDPRDCKRLGIKSGFPDLLLLVPRGEFHGLAIELKKTVGGVVSKNQKWWIDNLNANGYKAEICKGAAAAIETLKNYLNLPQGSAHSRRNRRGRPEPPPRGGS